MITLWGRNNSTNVKKVRWVLAELDLPYQQILAGLEYGLNHDPEYLAMNPNGLVPLLKDDANGLVLWESNAIIRYLAAQYGQNRLWVESPVQRAQGEKWMDWANATLSPAHRPVLMGLVRTRRTSAIRRPLRQVLTPVKGCSPCSTMNWRSMPGFLAMSSALAMWRWRRSFITCFPSSTTGSRGPIFSAGISKSSSVRPSATSS